MEVSETIIELIAKNKIVATPVNENSNIYSDLCYDSLSFILLLLEIEKIYSIKFELLEMADCLEVKKLIELIEKKIRKSKND